MSQAVRGDPIAAPPPGDVGSLHGERPEVREEMAAAWRWAIIERCNAQTVTPYNLINLQAPPCHGQHRL